MKMKAVRNGLLTLTVAALCAACQNNEAPAPKQSTAEAPAQTGSGLKIAFVLIDTLTNQYELYKDAQEKFQKKQANAENTINEKGKNFAAQVQSFQNRVQKNQITQEEYNNEQARLGKFQQDIQDLQTRLSNTLQEEYAKELQTLTDTIQSFMKSYAKEKGYDFILCKSSGIDQVLYANEAYDVTDEVVAALNKRYAKDKKNAPKKEEKKSK
ncbi:MAG: OmpH family outer membrane protein [Bacteroidaceae bacterium]|jgi:outer membrane protein|nr:OmpH family outer membrane protein [Bacteroidaceae bacterium]MBQ2199186.1 OmpH family outer membrane protein [Bacteroidaceae bacterium]MBQ2340345.1 OmpH family outer membrane protein [Bacteroidaceae bacterium]MBQ3628638.1 OmpH family outer membrane protein [Bacteroidaceae bacterium]